MEEAWKTPGRGHGRHRGGGMEAQGGGMEDTGEGAWKTPGRGHGGTGRGHGRHRGGGMEAQGGGMEGARNDQLLTHLRATIMCTLVHMLAL